MPMDRSLNRQVPTIRKPKRHYQLNFRDLIRIFINDEWNKTIWRKYYCPISIWYGLWSWIATDRIHYTQVSGTLTSHVIVFWCYKTQLKFHTGLYWEQRHLSNSSNVIYIYMINLLIAIITDKYKLEDQLNKVKSTHS